MFGQSPTLRHLRPVDFLCHLPAPPRGLELGQISAAPAPSVGFHPTGRGMPVLAGKKDVPEAILQGRLAARGSGTFSGLTTFLTSDPLTDI